MKHIHEGYEKDFVSAVVYVHDAGSRLAPFLAGLYGVLGANFGRYEVICVDDASTDGSREVIGRSARDAGAQAVSVIHMSMPQGVELSMDAGMDLAIGDFIFEFDTVRADFDPSLVMEVYHKAMEGYDIVSAVPRGRRGGSSALFYSLFNRYSGMGTAIRQETFRMVSRRAVNRVRSLNKALVYRKAAYAGSGLEWAYVEHPGGAGQGRGLRAQMERAGLAMDALILFTDVVQRLASLVSLLFLALTVAIGGYTWASYFSSHKPVEGWTPIMLFLSLGFFGVFLILTVTIRYLSLLLRLVYKKKAYLVGSIERVGG